MAPRDQSVNCRVVWLQLDGPIEQRQGLVRIQWHRGEGKRQRAEIQVVRIQALGPFAPGAFDLRLAKYRLDNAHYAHGQFVLDGEDIVESAVVTLSPDVGAAPSVDQLRRNAHAVRGFSDAAFEEVTDAQL